jgi:hypothetical protein
LQDTELDRDLDRSGLGTFVWKGGIDKLLEILGPADPWRRPRRHECGDCAACIAYLKDVSDGGKRKSSTLEPSDVPQSLKVGVVIEAEPTINSRGLQQSKALVVTDRAAPYLRSYR